MSDIATQLSKVWDVLQQHGFQFGQEGDSVLIGVLALIAGIGVSVLGAKLARGAVVLAFGALGVITGMAFARTSGIAMPVCVAVGAGLIAAIGYLTFRVWVGVGVAVLLSAITMSVFSYQELLPLVPQFQESSLASTADVSGGFSVPAPDDVKTPVREKLTRLGEDFWQFATERKENLPQHAQTLGLGTLVLGLFLGVIAVRWSLVLGTALAGTLLVAGSVCALAMEFSPDFYNAISRNPLAVGIALGGFFLTSVVLQALLTREATLDDPSEKRAVAR